MTEAEKHMTNAMAQFDAVEKAGESADAYSIVNELYLEPLRLQYNEPDWSRLERKPDKPPVPEVVYYSIPSRGFSVQVQHMLHTIISHLPGKQT